jgi:hypothetical protein
VGSMIDNRSPLTKRLAEIMPVKPKPPEPTGIHITFIVPPEQGWPVAMYCSLCRVTTFSLSPWGRKPEKGDYFRMNDVCPDEILGFEHNMRLRMKGYYDASIDLKPSSQGFPLFSKWSQI